jgi:hypothetical protein
MKKFAVFLLFFIILVGGVWGQNTYRWQGGYSPPLSMEWENNNNWVLLDDTSGAVISNPAALYPNSNTHNVIIAGANTWGIVINNPVELKSFDIRVTGRIDFNTLTNPSLVVEDLTVNEPFTVTNANVATETAIFNNILTLDPASQMDIQKNLTVASGNAGVNVNAGASLTMNGANITMNPNWPDGGIQINPVTNDIGNINAGNRPVEITVPQDGDVNIGDINSSANITINAGVDSEVDIGNITSGGTVTVNAGNGSVVNINDSTLPFTPNGNGTINVGTNNNPNDSDNKHWVYGPIQPSNLTGPSYYFVNSTTDPRTLIEPDSGYNIYIVDVIQAANLTFRATAGYIEFRGINTLTGTLTLDPGTGGVRLNDATINRGGNAFAPGAVTLYGTGNTINAASVTLGAITSASNNSLTINGSAGLPAANNANATLNGGTGIGVLTVNGTATFNASVSAASISVTGTSTFNNSITITTTATTGNVQNYQGAVTLNESITFTGNGVGATGGTVRFGSTVIGAGAGTASRQLRINNANVHFNGAVGTRIASVSVEGQGISTINGDITTTGNQTYSGAVVFGAANRILAGSSYQNSTVYFNGTVNSDNGTRTLTVNNADVRFNGDVVLAGLVVGPADVAGVRVAGTTYINANITIASNANNIMRLRGPVILERDVTFTANPGNAAAAFPFRFNSTVDSLAGNNFNLTVTTGAGAAANARFTGLVGSTTPLGNITVSGNTRMERGIRTTGSQDYGTAANGTVTIGTAPDPDLNNVRFSADAGSLIRFRGPVTGNAATQRLLVTNADVRFDGNVTNLANVSVQGTPAGTTTINANITTAGTAATGGQIYEGPVVLLAGATAITLNANIATPITLGEITGNGRNLTIAANAATATAAVTFNGATGIGALQINNNRPVVFSSAVLNAASVFVNGTGITTINTDIITTGDQTYNGAVTIGGTGLRTLSAGGTVTTTGAVSRAASTAGLIINAAGNITIGAGGINVTNTNPLTLESSAGNITVNGGVTALNLTMLANLTNGTVTLAGGGNITTGNALIPLLCPSDVPIVIYIHAYGFYAVSYTGTITPGLAPNEMCLDVNDFTFPSNNTWVAGMRYHLHGFNPNAHLIYISNAGGATLPADLVSVFPRSIETCASPIQVYSVGSNFNIYIVDIGNVSNDRNIQFSTNNGYIEIRGAYTSSNSLTLNPGSGGLKLRGADVNLTGTNSFDSNGIVELLPDTNGAVNTSLITAAGITLGAISGTANNNFTLADANGNVTLNGTIAENAVGILDINSSANININANITTSGNQTYNGALILGGNITFTGPAAGAGGRNIRFNGTVDADSTSNNRIFTVSNANVRFDGDINVGQIIVEPAVTARTISIYADNITTTNTGAQMQRYRGQVILHNDVTFTGAPGTTIRFNNGVNSGVADTNTLTVSSSGAGDPVIARFTDSPVGANARLAGVVVNGDTRITVNVNTSGDQIYNGNVEIEVATVTFDAGGTGNTVLFQNAVRSNNATVRAITINNANVGFLGQVGGTFPIIGGRPITSVTVGPVGAAGTTTMGANITTTGVQAYNGPVVLGTDIILTAGNAAGNTITLGVITGGDYDLTITSPGTAAGIVTFNGGTDIGVLQIDNNRPAVFSNAVLNAVSVSATGNSTINANIITSDFQNYTGTVTIGGNLQRNLTATNGSFTAAGIVTRATGYNEDIVITASQGIIMNANNTLTGNLTLSNISSNNISLTNTSASLTVASNNVGTGTINVTQTGALTVSTTSTASGVVDLRGTTGIIVNGQITGNGTLDLMSSNGAVTINSAIDRTNIDITSNTAAVSGTGQITGTGLTIIAATGISLINNLNNVETVSLINNTLGVITYNSNRQSSVNNLNITAINNAATGGNISITENAGNLVLGTIGSQAILTNTVNSTVNLSAFESINVNGNIGSSSARNGVVRLNSTNGKDITITGSIGCLRLLVRTSGSTHGTVTINGTITAVSTTPQYNDENSHEEDAIVYVLTGILTGNGAINLPLTTQSEVCAFVLYNSTFTGTVTQDRIHYHTFVNTNVVYRIGPQSGFDGSAMAPFLYLQAETLYGDNLLVHTTENVYIIGIFDFNGDGSHQLNQRNVHFTATQPGKFVEIRGDYYSSANLVLRTGTGGIQLNNANVNLTGSFGTHNNVNNNILLLNGDSSVRASSITVNDITAAAENVLALTATAGSVSVTGNTGTNGARLGNINVTGSGAVTFAGPVFSSGTTSISSSGLLSLGAQLVSSNGVIRSGTGSSNIGGNITASISGASVDFYNNVNITAFNLNVPVFVTTNNGEIKLGSVAGAHNLTLTSGTADISVFGTIADIEDFVINSTGNVDIAGAVSAASFTMNDSSADTGNIVFGNTQNYLGDFLFNGAAITANGNFTAGGVTVMNNSADFTLNANADFRGDYTTVNDDGTLIGANGINIQFGANVVLGDFTHNNSQIIFYNFSGIETEHTLGFLSPVSPELFNVYISRGSNLKLLAGFHVTQSDGSVLELQVGEDNIPGAILNITEGSWHVGTGGTTTNDFTGINGSLILGGTSDRSARNTLGSKIFTNRFNLTGNPFVLNNSGWAIIRVDGSSSVENAVYISDSSSLQFTGNFQRLILQMAGSGIQNFNAQRSIGCLHVNQNSVTVLHNDLELYGDVIINYTSSSGGVLNAGANNITVYAGITESKGKVSRWEITGTPENITSATVNVMYAFIQNQTNMVEFKKENVSDNNVFFEIIGNTVWQSFKCEAPGVTFQFSTHQHHHVFLNKFEVKGSESQKITLTRLPSVSGWVYRYTAALGPPPAPNAPNAHGLPFYPHVSAANLREDPNLEAERQKFWNFNLVLDNTIADQMDVDFVEVFFSHAWKQRITIDHTGNVFILPFYDAGGQQGAEGYFNYNWVLDVLRRIIYSFAEDGNGNGIVDRIRVQTPVDINGDFSGFNVIVDGFEIDRTKGWRRTNDSTPNGFDRVGRITTDDDDNDSFYIYLVEGPYLYDGQPIIWRIEENSTLRDTVRRLSIGSADGTVFTTINTIPPRVSYAITLPGHNETFIQMSQPVTSFNGNATIGGNRISSPRNHMSSALETAPVPPYLLDFPVSDVPKTYTLVNSERSRVGALNYRVALNSAPGVTGLASLGPIGQTPGEYFTLNGLWNLAVRALDWSDEKIDENSNYPPPKYPIDWNYSGYAVFRGNSHVSQSLTPDDQDNPNRNTEIFVPPFQVLTPQMMRKLEAWAAGERTNSNRVTPADFATADNRRRSTDILVSMAPSNTDSENYFAWPVWARYMDTSRHPTLNPGGNFWGQQDTDDGIIWLFDGTKYLQDRDFTIQARINKSRLPGFSGLNLFYAFNVPVEWRDPPESGERGRGSGGLWLPRVLHPVNPLYTMVPNVTINNKTGLRGFYPAVQKTPAASFDPLFNFNLERTEGNFASGGKLDFLFRLEGNSGSDPHMFVARLDAPAGANLRGLEWWTLIRPFSFDVQNIRRQRGGVTILNNVINSNNRELTFIRYHLVRPGRVTVQIHTLDGTLVRSLRRNEHREAGEWTDTWDGTNNGGRPVARGMYFVRVVGPDIDEIRKIMVVR